MSESLKTGLMISGILASLFSIVVAFAAYFRINSIRKKYTPKDENTIDQLKLNHPNYANIHKELKDKYQTNVNDDEMIFISATFIRNKFSTYKAIGEKTNYIKDTLIRNLNVKEVETNYETLLIETTNEWKNNVVLNYKNVSMNGLIFLLNVNEDKLIRDDITYFCDTNNLKYENLKFRSGICLIVKTKELVEFK